MGGKIVMTLVAAAGIATAAVFLTFLGLLIHEIGTFCDEVGDPFRHDVSMEEQEG